MIQLNDVSVRYGDTYALRSTSLKLHKGQFTVLLGASGAGKSTLLRCINMMCQPSAGTIDVVGLGLLQTDVYCRHIVVRPVWSFNSINSSLVALLCRTC